MAFQVKYSELYTETLMDFYVTEPDSRKDDITKADAQIHQVLELRPLQVGSPNPGPGKTADRRSFGYYPLQVDYVVRGNEVWVLAVRLDPPRFP